MLTTWKQSANKLPVLGNSDSTSLTRRITGITETVILNWVPLFNCSHVSGNPKILVGSYLDLWSDHFICTIEFLILLQIYFGDDGREGSIGMGYFLEHKL